MEILERLMYEVDQPNILHRIDKIESIVLDIETNHLELLQTAVDYLKDYIQEEARRAWIENGYFAMIFMATGSGKSKIPINVLKKAFVHNPNLKVLIIVPTARLRDKNWKEEFEKWGALQIYEKCVTTVCYASLAKIHGQRYDLVVGDEWHNATINNAKFFKNNHIAKFMGLTATKPTDEVKLRLFRKIPIAYTLSLDQATRLRLVAKYKMIVVNCKLNDQNAVIRMGGKSKEYYVTEKKAYELKCKMVDALGSKFAILDRLKFIKNLPSRVKNCKFILQNLIPPEKRFLIFAGGIEQAIELCPYSYFSKPSVKKSDTQDQVDRVNRILAHYKGSLYLDLFAEEKIDLLSAIAALNEGVNVPNVDGILKATVESDTKTITQQTGRSVRYRIGHTAYIIVVVYPETQEGIWARSALYEFDPSNITYIKMEDILSGEIKALIS